MSDETLEEVENKVRALIGEEGFMELYTYMLLWGTPVPNEVIKQVYSKHNKWNEANE